MGITIDFVLRVSTHHSQKRCQWAKGQRIISCLEAILKLLEPLEVIFQREMGLGSSPCLGLTRHEVRALFMLVRQRVNARQPSSARLVAAPQKHENAPSNTDEKHDSF